MDKGFHITLRSRLSSIYNKGLTPRIGKRSNSVDEPNKILSFTNTLINIAEWKKRLYPNSSFDDLIILTFPLDGVEYGKRYDSAGDFFTMNIIPKENLRIIEIYDRSGNKVSLDNLQQALANYDNQYEIVESIITCKNNTLSDEERQHVIEQLADYEHKKWSDWQDSILWTSQDLPNGDKTINKEKIKEILMNLNVEYDQTNEIYKREIRSRIKETLCIITESLMFDEMQISEEELINILESAEHDRVCRWIKSMLSKCIKNGEDYIIPKSIADGWESEIRTSYFELSENLKQSDREEVYNIFNSINNYKTYMLDVTGILHK